MSTKIRLARGGTKKRPYYKIVIADSRAPRDGRFIERVGSYNPMVAKDNDNRIILNKDRIEHWLSTGAIPSDRVALFLVNAGIGAENANIKTIVKKRNNVIKLKAAEVAEKKKIAAEEAAKKEAEAKAKADQEAKEKAEAEAAEKEAAKKVAEDKAKAELEAKEKAEAEAGEKEETTEKESETKTTE